MKKRARIVRNHPAYDKVKSQWVRVLSIHPDSLLEVADLLNADAEPHLVDSSRVTLWHPDNELNEARPSELIQIPLGSKVEVGPLKYTRVYEDAWTWELYDTEMNPLQWGDTLTLVKARDAAEKECDARKHSTYRAAEESLK